MVSVIVPVAINIHPGSFKNPFNLKSKGVIPVAVLTTRAGEYGLPLAFPEETLRVVGIVDRAVGALRGRAVAGVGQRLGRRGRVDPELGFDRSLPRFADPRPGLSRSGRAAGGDPGEAEGAGPEEAAHATKPLSARLPDWNTSLYRPRPATAPRFLWTSSRGSSPRSTPVRFLARSFAWRTACCALGTQ